MKFEQLTQNHTARKRHSQNSNSGLLMPVLGYQPILPVPFCTLTSHCANRSKKKRRRWGQLLLPPFSPIHIYCQGTGGEWLLQKSGRGCLFLSCSFSVIIRLWKETYLQNILKISLINLYSFPIRKQNKDPWILSHSLIIHYDCFRTSRRLAGGRKSGLTTRAKLLRSSPAPDSS